MTTFDLQRFFDGEADHERRRNLIDDKCPEYLEKYPRQWLALAVGDVWVLAESLEALVETLDAQGLPREDVIIRYLNPDPVTLVL